MPKSIPAIINPAMLTWTREQAGYKTIEDAAESKKIPAEKLRAWESGEKQPSIRQAENLAKIYHCSYSLFSLKEPPKVAALGTEYRRLPGIKAGEESPELRFALRDMIYRRRIALNLMEELGNIPEDFSLAASLNENAETLAQRVRKLLNVSIEEQFKWENDSQAWKGWRIAVESNGVLVLLFSDVEPDEVRGVSIFHNKLPVIGVNSHDTGASRPFTLLHEFIHILLVNGKEEKPANEERRSDTEWNNLERFVENVTGKILIPADALKKEEIIQSHLSNDEWSIKDIRRLANKFKVTPSALATRLLIEKLMTPFVYRKWKDDWNEYINSIPVKKSGGFATPAEKSLNKNGNIYTSLVIDALSQERITSVDASRYLNLNFTHIENLRMFYAFGRPLSTHSSGGE